jgi:hypothetical protein
VDHVRGREREEHDVLDDRERDDDRAGAKQPDREEDPAFAPRGEGRGGR